MTDRQHLLARLLRLEREVIRLRAIVSRRVVNQGDAGAWCDLRRQGMTVRAIAEQAGRWCHGTRGG